MHWMPGLKKLLCYRKFFIWVSLNYSGGHRIWTGIGLCRIRCPEVELRLRIYGRVRFSASRALVLLLGHLIRYSPPGFVHDAWCYVLPCVRGSSRWAQLLAHRRGIFERGCRTAGALVGTEQALCMMLCTTIRVAAGRCGRWALVHDSTVYIHCIDVIVKMRDHTQDSRARVKKPASDVLAYF